MEPVSLSLACVSTFKELFLLSRAVYQICQSAAHARSESLNLQTHFYHELLFLRDFGRLFLGNPDVLSRLNPGWLELVNLDLERLRHILGDFTELAAEIDDDYQAFSPRLHEDFVETGRIDFSLEVSAPALVESSRTMNASISKFLSWLSSKPKEFKWTLFDRRRFNVVIEEFRKWNAHLKELAPVSTVALSHSNGSSLATSIQKLEKLSQRIDIKTLGLKPYIQMQHLALVPASDKTSYKLTEFKYAVLHRTDSLMLGEIWPSHTPDKRIRVLLEYKEYSTNDLESSTDMWQQPVHKLASLLSVSGTSDLMTAPFKGYIREPGPFETYRYVFVFQIPDQVGDSSPSSIYNEISDVHKRSRPDLRCRFRIAKRLAVMMNSLHAAGWLHKSIRSTSIVLLTSGDFEHPYLVNFEYSRREQDSTHLAGDADFEKNLYRHPNRQGIPTTSFEKKHDVYALGLVLLEIGLWRTLKELWHNMPENKHKKAGEDERIRNPRLLREMFVETAKEELPHTMGQAYADAVVYCLQGGSQPEVQSGSRIIGAEGAYVEGNFADPIVMYKNVVEQLALGRLLE